MKFIKVTERPWGFDFAQQDNCQKGDGEWKEEMLIQEIFPVSAVRKAFIHHEGEFHVVRLLIDDEGRGRNMDFYMSYNPLSNDRKDWTFAKAKQLFDKLLEQLNEPD